MSSLAYVYVLSKNDRQYYPAPAAASSLANSLPLVNTFESLNINRIISYKASGSNCQISYKNEAGMVDRYIVSSSYATIQALVTAYTAKFAEVSVTTQNGVPLATAETREINSESVIIIYPTSADPTSKGAGAGTLNSTTEFLSYGAAAPAVGTRIRITAGTLTGNGVSANTDYYVQSVSTNDFTISLTLGGAAINLTGTNRTNLTFAVYDSGCTIVQQGQDGYIPVKTKVAASLEVVTTAFNA